jgi:predicted lipoprotein with Yx(FWY)xxD motif
MGLAPPTGRRSLQMRTPNDWSIVTRDDGGKQWAYKGKPLYAWSKDAKPGDVTGDGVNNVWHIAAP